jgi:hypothetical protein
MDVEERGRIGTLESARFSAMAFGRLRITLAT